MWTPTNVWHRLMDRLTRPAAPPAATPGPELESFHRLSLRPHPDVVSRQTGDEFFLVHLSGGSVYRLNRTGRLVWELLGTTPSAGEIARQVGSAYARSPDEVAPDVQALLRDLARNSLLEALPEAGQCASSSNCR
jgi:hypothetical protein